MTTGPTPPEAPTTGPAITRDNHVTVSTPHRPRPSRPGSAPPLTAELPHLMPQLPDYEVTARLGEGGMGVVWRATQLSTRRTVALKLLAPSAFGSRRARSRFEREVELAARLEHPNIARVYDSGIHRGIHYYAMELVEGVHLDAYVASRGLDQRAILALMRIVCLAVQHAHQRGVIHRDLKPSNILVSNDGQPYVVDFGLAKLAIPDEDRHQLSFDGQVAGTPAYMSPEQAAGDNDLVDTRSDVYTLGVILFRLLTGQSPHDLSGSSFTILKRIAEGEVRRPREASSTNSQPVSRELESLVLKAMATDPDDRYPSAAALAEDIANYLDGEPLTARGATTFYFLRKRVWKHRNAASVAAGIALAAFAGVGALYARPATVHIRTNPAGARIFVDGVEQAGCGTTPTALRLGPGSYDLMVDRGDGYVPEHRQIDVSWGRATGDVSEPMINFLPAFQTVIVSSDPEGVPVEIRDEGTDLIRHGFRTPAAVVLDRGRYTMHFGFTGDPATAPGERLQIAGDVEPLTIRRTSPATTTAAR